MTAKTESTKRKLSLLQLAEVRIPEQADHRIRSKPITRSSASRSLNPVQADHRFRWQADQFLVCTGMVRLGRPEGVSDAG